MTEADGWPAAIVALRATRHHEWPEGDMAELVVPLKAAAVFVRDDRRGIGLDALLIRIADYRLGNGAVASVERSLAGVPLLAGYAGRSAGAALWAWLRKPAVGSRRMPRAAIGGYRRANAATVAHPTTRSPRSPSAGS